MGRKPCCDKVGLKKGKWTADEDQILINYILAHGEGSWRTLPKNAGLLRCGKSCRLRWINYLRSYLKRGNITKEEEELIIKLHATQGNRWSLIAGHLPGKTDNEIKNYWNSHLSRRLLPSPVSDKTKSTSCSSVGNLPPSDQVVEDSVRRRGPIRPNTKKKKQKSATTAPPSPDMCNSCILDDPMMMVSDNISSAGTSTTTDSGQIHDVLSWLWDVDDIGCGGLDDGMAGDMIAWLLS